MSSNDALGKYNISLEYETPEDYLTEEERETIEKANSLANKAQDIQKTQTDLFNLSLRDLLKNWSINIQAILRELTLDIDISRMIKETDNIYEFTVSLVSKIWTIITKDYRMIYVGLTLVFISMVIYFVQASS